MKNKSLNYNNTKQEKVMKLVSSTGRLKVHLRTGVFQVSRLVASAFLGFDLNTPQKKAVIMHLDNDTLNNRVDNLKIGTQSENTKQCIGEGRGKQFGKKGEEHGYSKLTNKEVIEIRELNKSGVGYRQIEKIYPISKTNIADIIHRRIWKHI